MSRKPNYKKEPQTVKTEPYQPHPLDRACNSMTDAHIELQQATLKLGEALCAHVTRRESPGRAWVGLYARLVNALMTFDEQIEQ